MTIWWLLWVVAILMVGCGQKMEVFKGRHIEKPEFIAPEDSSALPAEFLSVCGPPLSFQLNASLSQYHRKEYDSCRSSLETLLGHDPSEWRAHYLLALTDFTEQDFDRAERSLMTALRFIEPEKRCRASIYLALGLTLENRGEYGRSKQHYLTAVRLDSTSVEARNGLDRLTTLTSVEQ